MNKKDDFFKKMHFFNFYPVFHSLMKRKGWSVLYTIQYVLRYFFTCCKNGFDDKPSKDELC